MKPWVKDSRQVHMRQELTESLAVLSAMITPAMLISACGSLTISTSNRLSRVVERTRKLADQFEKIAKDQPSTDLLVEQHQVLFDQLNRASSRSQLLQRAMTRLYLALSVFVATSVAIGTVALTELDYAWMPLAMGLVGAGLLFDASLLLIRESRIAVGSVRGEMRFLRRLAQHYTPEQLRPRPGDHEV